MQITLIIPSLFFFSSLSLDSLLPSLHLQYLALSGPFSVSSVPLPFAVQGGGGDSVQLSSLKLVPYPLSTMAFLNVLTLIVQGINSPHKRHKAFCLFSSNREHIVCLQETHLTNHLIPKYMGSSYLQFYAAFAKVKGRGVLIAFHHSTPFIL